MSALKTLSTTELEYELVWRKVQTCTLRIVDAQRALDAMRNKQEARLRELARIGARVVAAQEGGAA